MQRLYAVGALMAAGLLWALGFPLGKVALAEMPAARAVLFRFLFAAACCVPILVRGGAWRLLADPRVLVTGALYGLAFLLQFEGLERLDVSLAALLIGLMPALVAIAGRLDGERPGPLAWLGVAAAAAGAALLADVSKAEGEILGAALSLAALALLLAWILMLRRIPRQTDGLAVPAATIVVAALVVAPIAVAAHGAPHLRHPAQVWAALAAQGLLCTLLATAAWRYGAARVDSATAGVFINIEPLAGALIGVSLFGDPVTLEKLSGGALILAGSLAVVFGGIARRAVADQGGV